jgi:serine/threonine protein kinase
VQEPYQNPAAHVHSSPRARVPLPVRAGFRPAAPLGAHGHAGPTPLTAIQDSPRAGWRRRLALGVLFGSFTGFLLALAFLYAIRVAILHAKNAPAVVRGPVSFTPQVSSKNLLAALPSAQPLARGPHGTYYKLSLDNDLTVAVKRLDTANRAEASPSVSPGTSKSDMRRVQRQLEKLARVRHQNVMALMAYVREPDCLSLVYDFVPGGSLEDVMKRVRSQQVILSWDARSRIAVGIAKGLRHLHFESNPKILHSNLKPSNVMLDEGFEPILADCGVSRLIAAGSGDPELCSCIYAAPECYRSSR